MREEEHDCPRAFIRCPRCLCDHVDAQEVCDKCLEQDYVATCCLCLEVTPEDELQAGACRECVEDMMMTELAC